MDLDTNELNLTDDEQKAKEFMYRLITEGFVIECDENASDIKLELPAWYDEAKFKRGQKYYKDNRFGVLNSNMFGLLSAISDPKGVQILAGTGQSSTAETSKKRYVQTILHMVSWYDNDLVPGSKSWKSLELVRRMHYLASKQSIKKGLGIISVTEVALTAYGFMGYALTRPHLLGMVYDNREDREAFIFFWAVICSMLGVKDKYNMCLHSFEVVIIICEIIRRYIFMQILQLETPIFLQLGRAFIDGQKDFIPMLTFESVLFMTRRVAGVPGYQYDVDEAEENFPKQLFTVEEIKEMQKRGSHLGKFDYLRDFVLDGKLRLLDIKRRGSNGSTNNNNNNTSSNNNNVEKYTALDSEEPDELTGLHKVMGLTRPDDLTVITVENDDFNMYLNDSAFHTLSMKDQMILRLRMIATRNNTKWWGHWIHERLTDRIFKQMEQYLESTKKNGAKH